MTMLRPDGHSLYIPTGEWNLPRGFEDCLHYCLPGGPIETWADALVEALMPSSLLK